MEERMRKTTMGAIMMFGGGLVGAGLALLFAPQSGKRSRRDIARFGRHVVDRKDRMVRNFTDFGEKVGDKVTDMSSFMHRKSLFH